MRNLTFKYIAAWNFLPFGPEGIQLSLENYGNIILIRGENRDAKAIDADSSIHQSEESKISSNGSGKCFRKNTKILMFDGSFKFVQDIKIDDLVMGPDSLPRKVLSLGRGKEEMFEIAPKKGDSYFVNKSHILTLKKMSKKYEYLPNVMNVSVTDYLKLPYWKQRLYGTYRASVTFPKQNVPIDPYVLGLWLGDGTNSKPEITTADRPILDAVVQEAYNRGLRSKINLTHGNKSCSVKILSFRSSSVVTSSDMANKAKELSSTGMNVRQISESLGGDKKIRHSTVHRWVNADKGASCENSFLNDLRSLGLMSTDKFIPNKYKINDRETRLQILAGIIDTDGSLSGTGFDFINKSKQLAEDVVFIARSLGMAANIKQCHKKCCNNGVIGLYYRVSIFGNCDEIPVRLSRKKANKRTINKNCLKTGIKVSPIGEEDFYGFSVDKDHLFLLGDFTVVHNSSIQEIIVYGLFGKTVKQKVSKDQVVHNIVGKDCKIELIFGDYRIVRTRMEGGRKENCSLRLWESPEGLWDQSTEITQGTIPTTQKKIESVIGLSYDAFINMCIFTDDQRLCFLECDNPQKKEIVENLLSLGEYREWHENAKDLRKTIKQSIDSKAKEYNLLLSNKDDAKRRLALTEEKHVNWQTLKKNEIVGLEKLILTKKEALASTDTGVALLAYQEAQSKINSINESLPILETSKDDWTQKLVLTKNKDSELKLEAQGLTEQYEEFSATAKAKLTARKKNETEISDLESNKPGTRCGKCRSIVEEENIIEYVNGLKLEINNLNLDIQAIMVSSKEIAAKTENLKLRQGKVTAIITQINAKISEIDAELKTLRDDLVSASKVREPKADSAEALLEQEISQIKNMLESKTIELTGKSPYQDIIDNDKVELEKVTINVANKEAEVKNLEAELPYFDYWIAGFGEHGIRKWVVDGIIPELNNRINYWLQFLIDNKITLKFDNELNEKIERSPADGDPYVYHAMSTGQRRRLNLAVSQSFAHVMTISSGSIPSIVFLDEVSTNIDPLGVLGVYNMICELAEDKKVFVTTHDPDLLRMLQGSDVIKVTHENGYTKLG